MAYWSSETLRERIPDGKLIVPYDPDRVKHCAYEMGVGGEAFVTSKSSDRTRLPPGDQIEIPPGQFGLLVTEEVVTVPSDAIAFISIRAGIKFRGLVNVSGFHVDPGFVGQLIFAVYNAGSKPIKLDQKQPIFMIWFCDLDDPTQDLHKGRPASANVITAEDVMRIQGDVASPAELKKQIDALKSDYDKRLYDLKTESDKKMFEVKLDLEKKLHAIEQSQLWNRWMYGLIVTGIVTILVTSYFRPWLEGMAKSKPAAAVPGGAQDQQKALTPGPAAKPNIGKVVP